MIPELSKLSCYPKFPNEIRVFGISGLGSGILGLGYEFFLSRKCEDGGTTSTFQTCILLVYKMIVANITMS